MLRDWCGATRSPVSPHTDCVERYGDRPGRTAQARRSPPLRSPWASRTSRTIRLPSSNSPPDSVLLGQ